MLLFFVCSRAVTCTAPSLTPFVGVLNEEEEEEEDDEDDDVAERIVQGEQEPRGRSSIAREV